MSAVTIHYLEQTSADDLLSADWPAGCAASLRGEQDWRFNRQMYQQVGADWSWTDKLSWSDTDWQRYAGSATLSTWSLNLPEGCAGYAELEQQAEGQVQLAYFGLLPPFTGRRLGGAFLSTVLHRAWSWPDTRRIWVHTCTLDHPAALRNYQARGMRHYRSELQA